jgi:hypothetical protein
MNIETPTLTHEDLETKLQVLSKLVTLGWTLLTGAFILGVWVATLELRTETAGKNIESVNATAKMNNTLIQEINLWRASTEANRWTIQQQTTSMLPIYDSMNAHDKRIQRLEDGQISISKALDRIENKLGTAK